MQTLLIVGIGIVAAVAVGFYLWGGIKRKGNSASGLGCGECPFGVSGTGVGCGLQDPNDR